MKSFAMLAERAAPEAPPPQKMQATAHYVIIFSMEIRASDKRRTALLKMLRSALGPTRAAPGCLEAHLYYGTGKNRTLLLVEEWKSRADFEFSLYPAKLNAIVAAIDLSGQAPIVRVDTVDRREGMDGLALWCEKLGQNER